MAFYTLQSSVLQEWASQLDVLFARCEGAYSDLTLSGYRKDLEIFAVWCARNRGALLPADQKATAGFLNHQLATCSYPTIRRRASAIRFTHVMSDVPSPMRQVDVQLALRRAVRAKGRRPKQVLGLTRDLLDKMLASCPQTLAGRRDAALLSVGYDTLCRSAELSWMRVEDVFLDKAKIYIPRSNSDPFGDGRVATISATTIARVTDWLENSALEEGPLFRGLHAGKVGRILLGTSSIRRLIKSAALRAGLTAEALLLSGHSMRVGADRDLLASGYDTLAIMTAGGWKSTNVVARYVELSKFDRKKSLFDARLH